MADTSVIFNLLGRDVSATSAVHKVSRTWLQVAGGFVTGSVVMGGLSRAFGFAKDAAIGFNSQLQNSGIAFTTMLGSAQKSKAFLDQLQAFAKTTPFEFGQLVKNAQNMMGMGIAAKDVIPDLRALGDSVASVGGSAQQVDQVTLAFDQMMAKGTLDMGNMNQLLQGGVPSALKILAASYKVTTGQMIQMISTGKVQSSVALPALVAGIEKGTSATAALGGMMDKQSQTFSGALSNISDGLTQALAGVFKPFFGIITTGAQSLGNFFSGSGFSAFGAKISSAMTAGISAVRKFVTSFNWTPIKKAIGAVWFVITKDLFPSVRNLVKTFGPLVITVGKDLFAAIGKLGGVLKPMGGWVKATFGFIASNKTVFRAVAVGVGAIVVAMTAWKVITGAWAAITRIATAVQAAFNLVMDANPIGLVIIALVGLVAAFAYLWTHSKAFRDFFIAMWHDIWGVVKAVGHWFSDSLPHFFEVAWGKITGAFGAAKNWVVGRWNDLIGFFKSLPGKFAAIGTHLWDWITRGFHIAVNTIISGLNYVIDGINVITHGLSDVWSWTGIPAIPAIPHVPKLATGGDILRSGFATVGERGPETVYLPAGARVLPHGAAGGGSVRVELCAAPGDQVAELILSLLRPTVRGKYGGDVQTAAGGYR